MPSAPTLTARDRRILAGHRAGATILDLAIAEEVDPAVVRRVLRAAGIAPGPSTRPLPSLTPKPVQLAPSSRLRNAKGLASDNAMPNVRPA